MYMRSKNNYILNMCARPELHQSPQTWFLLSILPIEYNFALFSQSTSLASYLFWLLKMFSVVLFSPNHVDCCLKDKS